MNLITFDYIEESYEEWLDANHSETVPKFSTMVYIDKVNLIDHLKKYELPFAQKAGHPEIAGLYIGNSPSIESVGHYFDLADFSTSKFVYLFQCKECMSSLCPYNLRFKIRKDKQYVYWYDFQQQKSEYPFVWPPYTSKKNPHQELMKSKAGWDYKTFGPFKFSEENYTQALNALKQKVLQSTQ